MDVGGMPDAGALARGRRLAWLVPCCGGAIEALRGDGMKAEWRSGWMEELMQVWKEINVCSDFKRPKRGCKRALRLKRCKSTSHVGPRVHVGLFGWQIQTCANISFSVLEPPKAVSQHLCYLVAVIFCILA